MTTLPRLPRFLPGDLTPGQRALYSAIVDGPRSRGESAFDIVAPDGGLHGPFNALLLNPALGDALQRLGSAVRYEGSLEPRVREAAILIVAAVVRSDFEQDAHEAVGRQVGLTESELEELRTGRPNLIFDADSVERECLKLVVQLASNSPIDDEAYRHFDHTLGAATIFELSTLVGYYKTLALQLALFGVDRPTSHDDGDP